MQLHNTPSGPVEVIIMSGSLDGEEAPAFRNSLNKWISTGRTRLLLDLSLVDFIDSTGLSALIGALKATRRSGGNIGLLNPVPNVRSVLEMTRLHRMLEIFSDQEKAVAKLSS